MEVRNFGAPRYECSPRESLELETVFSRTGGIAYHGGYKGPISCVKRLCITCCLHGNEPFKPFYFLIWCLRNAVREMQSLQPHEYVMPCSTFYWHVFVVLKFIATAMLEISHQAYYIGISYWVE